MGTVQPNLAGNADYHWVLLIITRGCSALSLCIADQWVLLITRGCSASSLCIADHWVLILLPHHHHQPLQHPQQHTHLALPTDRCAQHPPPCVGMGWCLERRRVTWVLHEMGTTGAALSTARWSLGGSVIGAPHPSAGAWTPPGWGLPLSVKIQAAQNKALVLLQQSAARIWGSMQHSMVLCGG